MKALDEYYLLVVFTLLANSFANVMFNLSRGIWQRKGKKKPDWIYSPSFLFTDSKGALAEIWQGFNDSLWNKLKTGAFNLNQLHDPLLSSLSDLKINKEHCDLQDNSVQRVRTFFVVPQDGDYTFMMKCDDKCIITIKEMENSSVKLAFHESAANELEK